MKSNVESYQAMNMGPRNLLILFFSAVAVSLVILIILSSLVFKNLSLDFNTHMPETTPDIGSQFSSQTQSMNPDSKADNVSRATVNVPPESVEPALPAQGTAKDQNAADTAPVTDDAVLENNAPLPLDNKIDNSMDTNVAPLPATTKSGTEKASKTNVSTPRAIMRPPAERKIEPMAPAYNPDNSNANEAPESSSPPVPGQ